MPSLWWHAFAADDRTPDPYDACAVASWLSKADRSGQLERFLQLNGDAAELGVERLARLADVGEVLPVAEAVVVVIARAMTFCLPIFSVYRRSSADRFLMVPTAGP